MCHPHQQKQSKNQKERGTKGRSYFVIFVHLFSWSTDNGIIKQQVERVKWAPHLPFAKQVRTYNLVINLNQMLKLREPTILTNTVTSQWKAIEHWSQPDYLSSHPV
jgi:hypothetical protein